MVRYYTYKPTRLQASTTLAQYWSAPSASISWDNLQHIRVYAVDPNGDIREWQWDGNGWSGPSYIGAKARVGTIVTAANDGPRVSLINSLGTAQCIY
jgi:hypothetical protein